MSMKTEFKDDCDSENTIDAVDADRGCLYRLAGDGAYVIPMSFDQDIDNPLSGIAVLLYDTDIEAWVVSEVGLSTPLQYVYRSATIHITRGE